MKIAFTLLAASLACGAVLAQAPAGVNPRPSQEQNPNASGGKAQEKAAMNTEARTGGSTAVMGSHKAMDANKDGMISRKEWDAYHGKMWRSMKADKQGNVPWATVESGMRGTPD